MTDFRSSKPKPIWMSAAQQVSNDLDGGRVDPNRIARLDPAMIDRVESKSPESARAVAQLRVYGNTKQGSARELPAKSDAIVRLPRNSR